jgi:hypothetical protein
MSIKSPTPSMKDQWKPLILTDVQPCYIISDTAKIYDMSTSRFLSANPSAADGFCRVALRSLSGDPEQRVYLIHHLVYLTFKKKEYDIKIEQGHRIIHKNGDTSINHLHNLELVERGLSYLQKRGHNYSDVTRVRFVGGQKVPIC